MASLLDILPNPLRSLFYFELERSELLAWLLPITLLLVILVGFRRGRRVSALLSRLLVFFLLLIALAKPFSSSTSIFDAPGNLLLLDVSSSMSDGAINDCIEKAAQAFGKLNITTFSDDIKIVADLDNLALTNRENALTNFEKTFSSLSQSHQNTAAYLCSDGIETLGDINKSINLIRQKQIRVSPILPDARLLAANEIRLKSLNGPYRSELGESVEFQASIEKMSSTAFSGKALFLLNSKSSGHEKAIKLDPRKEIKISESFSDLPAGFHKITLQIPELPNEQLSRWIEVRERPRLLIIHGAANERNLSENLLKTLGYERDSIVAGGTALPDSLKPYTGVILNNVPKRQLSETFLVNLKSHVNEGAGLLILGGDKSFGLGGYGGSILDEVSPLLAVPPRAKIKRLPSAVVLVIDKSGSMNEQGRMTSARLASLSAVQTMRDEDFIGIIGFDQAPLSVMDITQVAKAKQEAEYKLRNLVARGGTNLLPALSLARLRLGKIDAGKKHIIVLSDGIFPNSSNTFVKEINNIKSAGITMSTIALGADADAPFLKMLAQTGKGNFYQVMNPNTLPRIFLDDIKVAMGEDTMKEESDFNVTLGPAGLVSSSVKGFPPLKGFVETRAKDRARLELITRKGGEVFPVFASWNYGKGSAYAFSSDLQGRWTTRWIQWSDITLFWDDIFRKLKGNKENNEKDIDFDVRYEIQGQKLSLNLFLYEAALANQLSTIEVKISGPGDAKNGEMQLNKKEAGWFEGSFELNKPGDYFLDLQFNKETKTRIGISVSPSELGEKSGMGINFALLKRLAQETGGEVNPDRLPTGEDITAPPKDKTLTSKKSLGWPFVFGALVLLLFEVFIRERRKL